MFHNITRLAYMSLIDFVPDHEPYKQCFGAHATPSPTTSPSPRS